MADALERLWESDFNRETLAGAGRRRADRYAALDVVGTYHRILAGSRG